VVGKAQAQGAQLECVQQLAEPDVPVGVRVPLGQHEHGPAAAPGAALGKVPCVHDVVLGMRRGHGARKRQAIADERVAFGGVHLVELVACRHRSIRPRHDRVVVDLRRRLETVQPVEPPLERPDDPVGVGRGEPALPVVKNPRDHVERSSMSTERWARGDSRGGRGVAPGYGMIEQPPQPDVPRPSDPIGHPLPPTMPVPPDEPGQDDTPDVHPVPPPTDPGPSAI
jgi:hypothetical protein